MPSYLSHFINKQWCQGSGASFISRNPATGEIIWRGESAAEYEVKAAVNAARSAFEVWSDVPFEKRLLYAYAFRDVLISSIDVLARIISQETGKPLWESKTEVNAMISKVEISAEAYRKRCGEVVREQAKAKGITRHKPYGVAVVLGPFNFPGHLPNGHIIPALLAGNTVILKPSELAPMVSEAIMHCWEKVAMPEGVINLLQGGRETGRLLVGQHGIDALFFTGSWQTGKILAEQFSKTPEKMLALELGGNNPIIVSDVSDHKAAALLTIQSAYATAGQRCSCARRLIVPEGKSGDAFIKTLIEMINKIKVGPFTDSPEPYMGPVITEAVAKYLLAIQQNFIAKGGRPLVKMKLLKVDTALVSPGLMDVTDVVNRPDEEIFGPFLQLIRVPDFDTAIREANNTSYGLCAGLLSDSKDNYDEFYRRIYAGVVNWNMPTTGASSSAPFGGLGRSGNHRPGGYYAADYCSYPVASMESIKLKMPEIIPPGITS